MRRKKLPVVLLACLMAVSALAPCFASPESMANCPMSGCDGPVPAAKAPRHCCCGDTKPATETNPDVARVQPDVAAVPAAGDNAPAPRDTAEPSIFAGAVRSPDPVPLYLRNASLLI